MIRFWTESGAQYVIDGDTLTRLPGSPHSPGIFYDKVPDGAQHKIVSRSGIQLRERASFLLEGGIFRVTTPVEMIVDDTNPYGED